MKRPADDEEADSALPKQLPNRPPPPKQQQQSVSSSPTAGQNHRIVETGGGSSMINGDLSSNSSPPPRSNNLNSPTGIVNDHDHHPTNYRNSSMEASMDEKVAILDCGAQYGKVIDRRVRELNVESEILPLSTPLEILLEKKYKAIIISGGPKSVYSSDASAYDARIFSSKIPILGICYGLQLINKEFGGNVEKHNSRYDGQLEVKIDNSCAVFKGLQETEMVLLTHGDVVKAVAPGFKPIAHCNGYIAGIANEQQKVYGVQFHPEVDLTPSGQDIFRNFLFDVAGCRGSYTMRTREKFCIDEIQRIVKEKKVLLLCSGGVDSTVCAALLKRALGRDRVYAVHIDNGFMRKNESQQVQKSLEHLDVNLRVYNKASAFYNGTTIIVDRKTGEKIDYGPLMRTSNPEFKRRIIGDTFIKVTEEVLAELKLNYDDIYLAQGTLRPDLIESASHLASGGADAIKTHHNDTELVRALRAKGRVVEPLKDFHKDEVRKLGVDLGLPENLVMRHPFPGPGLAIRILCSTEPYMCRDFNDMHNRLRVLAEFHEYAPCGDSKEDNDVYQRLSASLQQHEQDQLKQWSATLKFQYTLLPIQSVGVQGDSRTYSYVVAISTNSKPVPWSTLMRLARLLTRIFDRVNRVVYVFGPALKESALMDVTPTLLTSTTIRLAQEADWAATSVLSASGHMKTLSQMPVICVPIHFDRPSPPTSEHPSLLWSVVIRTFITNDFMTGIPAEPGLHIPEEVVESMVTNVKKEVPLISRVLYDLTAKPPGTTEWE